MFIIILLLYCQYLPAQTEEAPISKDSSFASDTSIVKKDTMKYFKISITSNLKDAKIYSDTSLIGFTPLLNYQIHAGNQNLKIINPKSLQDWQNYNESVNIFIDRDTSININFRYFYFINTNPYEASVFKNDTLLGDTPLRFFNDSEMTGSLLIKKKNFRDYILNLNDYNFETGANINLQSKGIETVNDIIYKNRSTQFNTKRNLPAILATGGAALAGCFFAINFKNDANNEYDRYLKTGNETQLDNSQKNDTYFIISVVLMEAAIGGLIYFLFFDK